MIDYREKLTQLLVDNPDLLLVVFAGEEANMGEWFFSPTEIKSVDIEDVALWKDGNKSVLVRKGEYEQTLYEQIRREEQDPNAPEEYLEEILEYRMENSEFRKCICVCVDK